jgi:hypothetical protein
LTVFALIPSAWAMPLFAGREPPNEDLGRLFVQQQMVVSEM